MWYTANTWVYAWLPFVNYDHLGVSTSSTYRCDKCDCRSSIESKGYSMRPMFELDKIVWVIHRRFRFKCGHSTNSLCPKLLAQLPTAVVEQFLYVTRNKGPGMHESLVQTLAFLCTNKVLFQTTVNLVNEIHSIKYSKDHINYYDTQ